MNNDSQTQWPLPPTGNEELPLPFPPPLPLCPFIILRPHIPRFCYEQEQNRRRQAAAPHYETISHESLGTIIGDRPTSINLDMVRMDASAMHELSGYGGFRKGIHQPWTATQTPTDSLWIAWIRQSTPRTDSVDLSEYAVDIEDRGSSLNSAAPVPVPSTPANAVAPLTAPIETTKTDI